MAENLGLADAIRARRETRGLTLRAAAKEVGVSAATLSRLENGYDIYLSHAQQVEAWLGPAEERSAAEVIRVGLAMLQREEAARDFRAAAAEHEA